MIPDRAPSTIWCLRRDMQGALVATEADERIAIHDGRGTSIVLSRSDARLLAKRINQCLDSTVKR